MKKLKFIILNQKKAPGKTQTGTEFGRLLDCKVALFLEKASLVYSIPISFPRWSWGTRVLCAKGNFSKYGK